MDTDETALKRVSTFRMTANDAESKSGSETESHPDAELLVQRDVREPRRYEVLLHNDDYTTMEFVVAVLMEVFHRNAEQAAAIMLSVHRHGVGVAGVYTREIAETKVEAVRRRARKAGYPLRCTLREVSP